jgi:arylformamidase
MTIYDISLSISESLIVWPGDPPVGISQPAHVDRGDAFTVSRLDVGSHVGTHVDAPAHMIRGGQTVDGLALEVLIGPAWVAYVPGASVLSAEVLETLDLPAGVERVLFRTRNSERWAHGEAGFFRGYVGVSGDGARWLVDHGVRLVGIDYLSIAPFDDPVSAHQVLLGAGVVVVEGLNLSGVEPGSYRLICLPLKIAGAEGAPARVVLVDEDVSR